MQFIDQPGGQILSDSGSSTTQPYIAVTRGSLRLFQCRMDAIRHKPKFRSTSHPERRPRVMSQHEDRYMIRRLIAPPPFP